MDTRTVLQDAGDRLYERVAANVERLIGEGTLVPGQRVPSVRTLSRTLRVSVSTVLGAYNLLEDRGLIRARPQSGYYVRYRSVPRPAEPELTRPAMDAARVSMGDLVMMVLRDTGNPGLLQLGATIPSPDLLPAEKLGRTLANVERRNRARGVSYEMSPGCEALRVQVARRLLDAGCTASPDEVVVTVGCQEGIFLGLQALCRPGDAVAVESPTYFHYLQAIEALGLRAVEIPTHPREGLSLDALRFALDQTPIRAVLAIPNFNNPLGGRMPEENKRELVELLGRRDIPLLEDDIHGDLFFEGERPSVAKAYDRKGLVLLCSSVSKTLAPGYRVGWILPGRFQRSVEHLKAVTNLGTPTLPQLAVAEFLANGGYDRHLRRLRTAAAQNMEEMSRAVARHFPEGTRITRPAGGFALWVELPPGTDSVALYERALRHGITVAPGPIFSAKHAYRNFLRLNAGFWSDRVASAVKILGELVAPKR